ncbi:vacuolar import and degradation protein [Rhizoctonia solani AG-3 Rhs1AP]|uniref:Vacuolar import and degradation protein n=2 Tax=Rhizoctonia solani AG-3 TaxID=1086053 RepID=A0A074S3N7_9AGAM|nr:vacuolar import and degradation protein [Rhizoctonia solani AG-3 Rhs1AP]KEP53854.1 vacuolar import and degradation protein [Rhizoctonia solani 123E]
MPTEQVMTSPTAVETHMTSAPQIKLCGLCHGPLSDTPELVFVGPASPSDAFSPGPYCSSCAERARSLVHENVFGSPLAPRLRRQSTLAPIDEPTEYTDPQPTTHILESQSPQQMDLSPLAIGPCAFDSHSVPSHHSHPARSLSSPHSPPPSDREPPRDTPRSRSAALSEPDPYTDVTRLRLNNTRQDCLYPGAQFVGIQKSGRNSYNVSVTIVNVDFPGSTLCGYLTIENLTDDHPQLTTYFDAEIIGPKYGFLTQSYGASEMDDMTHWGRFDSFRAIKSEMRRPGLTIRQKSLSERGFVFMRWKERFLVPEHQVRGIRGASYDGFYYVCVQLNSPTDSPSTTHNNPFREPTSPVQSYHPLPHPPHPHHTHPHVPPTRTRTMSSASANSARSPGPISPEVLQSAEEFPPLSPTSSRRMSQPQQPRIHTQNLNHRPTSPTSPRITRSRESFSGSGGGRGPRTSTATMTGFYFHQNSEPYQQLTLHHQPERMTSVFEFC